MRNYGVRVMVLLTLAVSVLWALPALAAETAVNPVGEALAHVLQIDIVPLIAAIVTTLLGIVLDKIRKKYNLDISAQRQEQLNALARQGVALAAEKAAALLKEKGTRLTGSNKLDIAISHVIAMAPAITIEQADALVHSILATTAGEGATGSTAL